MLQAAHTLFDRSRGECRRWERAWAKEHCEQARWSPLFDRSRFGTQDEAHAKGAHPRRAGSEEALDQGADEGHEVEAGQGTGPSEGDRSKRKLRELIPFLSVDDKVAATTRELEFTSDPVNRRVVTLEPVKTENDRIWNRDECK
ncbi:hypothetical protein TRAPUB_12829 [Trametes pubescens]|uniref:Uncharacterized protein n=1 Tax=Trametes pubescens TaxID=154538 RepID=A0A1M2VST8_TRAPU|nr:hypothetical protein TRAPUB_12829 [Trametes pubescens]